MKRLTQDVQTCLMGEAWDGTLGFKKSESGVEVVPHGSAAGGFCGMCDVKLDALCLSVPG